ncbi:MAG: family 43 glycosylhydrolase [Planctomycetota bacterium]
MQVRNPIIGGFHPDPSICRVGDTYYLATSSFEFFPGVPVYRSTDLVHWEQIGHALHRPEQLDLSESRHSQGIWAPSLRYIDGRFVLVTTLVSTRVWPAMFRNFFVTADDPAGPWSEPTWLDEGGIDPDIVRGPDGRTWYLRGDKGVMCAPISWPDGRLGERRWHWPGTAQDYTEGPHLYHIAGRYYLWAAEGGTGMGHSMVCARADDIDGPWEPCPWNPILSNRGTSRAIQCTGHADLVQTPAGDWYAVLLGIRDLDGIGPLGRETHLAPVTWREGWPIVGRDGRVDEHLEVPDLDTAQPEERLLQDDFEDGPRPLFWNTRGNEPAGAVQRGSGRLALAANGVGLDDEQPMAFLGLRQYDRCASLAVDLHRPAEGVLAGLSVYACPDHHYDLLFDGAGVLRIRVRLGAMGAEVAQRTLPDGPARIGLQADRGSYRLGLWEGEELTLLATLPARHLGSTVAGTFTGVYLALVAEGAAGTAAAVFEGLRYCGLEMAEDTLPPAPWTQARRP